jgi:hypothetical protein
MAQLQETMKAETVPVSGTVQQQLDQANG